MYIYLNLWVVATFYLFFGNPNKQQLALFKKANSEQIAQLEFVVKYSSYNCKDMEHYTLYTRLH